MKVQYLSNDKGEKTAVLIPMKEWSALEKEHETLRRKLEKAELSLRFKKVLKDVALYKQGKLKTKPIKDLFDEL
ncbi:MAG TPA: hypothetical protein VN040_09790 [Pseudosphingobacterium sp.]|jgi:hypothetical protein|nr:hypothetical protein [Pseudosphingobacterium sp.]